MAWSVWGRDYTTAELTNSTHTARCKMNEHTVLRAVRVGITVLNNPTFTNLSMKIFSDKEDDTKGGLIATSTNVITKSEITTLANAIKEIYFEFNDVLLHGSLYYHFGLTGTGHSFSPTSTIAWKKAWPNPIYTLNLTTTLVSSGTAPFDLHFIGADFNGI